MSIILYVNIYYPLIILQNISAFKISTALEKKQEKQATSSHSLFFKWFFFVYFLLCCVICDDILLSLVNSAKCNFLFLSMLLFYFIIFSFTLYFFLLIHLRSSRISSRVFINIVCYLDLSIFVLKAHYIDFSWLHV